MRSEDYVVQIIDPSMLFRYSTHMDIMFGSTLIDINKLLCMIDEIQWLNVSIYRAAELIPSPARWYRQDLI